MKISEKILKTFIILVFFIVLFESLEVLFLGKDQHFIEELNKISPQNLNESDVMSFFLMNFFRQVHIPVIFILYTYFGRNHLSFGCLYRLVFILLFSLTILYHFVGHHIRTLFTYPIILMEIFIILILMNLRKED